MWRLIFPDHPDVVVESLEGKHLRQFSSTAPTPVVSFGQEPPRTQPYYIHEYAMHSIDWERHLAYYRRVK
jgi:hypothetical protein